MMKKLLTLFFIASLTNSCSVAQVASQYAETITVDGAREHLTLLSSRSYEGRGTGQPGGMKTARYIADLFETYGLNPIVNGSYFQPVALLQTSYKVEEMSIGGQHLRNAVDFFVQGDNSFSDFGTDEIIFVGYGIQDPKYDELAGTAIQGKVVLFINEDEPVDPDGRSRITGKAGKSRWSSDRFRRMQELLKHQPKLILATGVEAEQIIRKANNRNITGRFQLDDGTSASYASRQNIPVIHVTQKIADNILKPSQLSLQQFKNRANRATTTMRATTVATNLSAKMGILSEKLDDPNVLGLVEGTDLKDEIVVICGHYDHDGILPDSTFFPGADDNGSGTVAVLELAQAFAQAKKDGYGPRRSILFIGLAAEEKGLLGSKYYAENPILPLANTVACINIDMIGRIDDMHLNGNHNYIHVIGVNKLSTELKPIVEKANKDIGLELDYSYDRPNEPMRLYYRSDHYNFAKKGIPSLFFFSGLHPHYHTPEDTVDKIDFPMMVKREKLIFHTAWDIANRDTRLKVDLKE